MAKDTKKSPEKMQDWQATDLAPEKRRELVRGQLEGLKSSVEEAKTQEQIRELEIRELEQVQSLQEVARNFEKVSEAEREEFFTEMEIRLSVSLARLVAEGQIDAKQLDAAQLSLIAKNPEYKLSGSEREAFELLQAEVLARPESALARAWEQHQMTAEIIRNAQSYAEMGQDRGFQANVRELVSHPIEASQEVATQAYESSKPTLDTINKFMRENPAQTMLIIGAGQLALYGAYKLFFAKEKSGEGVEKKEGQDAVENKPHRMRNWLIGGLLAAGAGAGLYLEREHLNKFLKNWLGLGVLEELKKAQEAFLPTEQYGLEPKERAEAEEAFKRNKLEEVEKIFADHPEDLPRFQEAMRVKYEVVQEEGVEYTSSESALENYKQELGNMTQKFQLYAEKHAAELLLTGAVATKLGITRGAGGFIEYAIKEPLKLAKVLAEEGIKHPFISVLAVSGGALGLIEIMQIKNDKELKLPEDLTNFCKLFSVQKGVMAEKVMAKLDSIEGFADQKENIQKIAEEVKKAGFAEYATHSLEGVWPQLRGAALEIIQGSSEEIAFRNHRASLETLELEIKSLLSSPDNTPEQQEKYNLEKETQEKFLAFKSAFLELSKDPQDVEKGKALRVLYDDLRERLAATMGILLYENENKLSYQHNENDVPLDLCANPFHPDFQNAQKRMEISQELYTKQGVMQTVVESALEEFKKNNHEMLNKPWAFVAHGMLVVVEQSTKRCFTLPIEMAQDLLKKEKVHSSYDFALDSGKLLYSGVIFSLSAEAVRSLLVRPVKYMVIGGNSEKLPRLSIRLLKNAAPVYGPASAIFEAYHHTQEFALRLLGKEKSGTIQRILQETGLTVRDIRNLESGRIRLHPVRYNQLVRLCAGDFVDGFVPSKANIEDLKNAVRNRLRSKARSGIMVQYNYENVNELWHDICRPGSRYAAPAVTAEASGAGRASGVSGEPETPRVVEPTPTTPEPEIGRTPAPEAPTPRANNVVPFPSASEAPAPTRMAVPDGAPTPAPVPQSQPDNIIPLHQPEVVPASVPETVETKITALQPEELYWARKYLGPERLAQKMEKLGFTAEEAAKLAKALKENPRVSMLEIINQNLPEGRVVEFGKIKFLRVAGATLAFAGAAASVYEVIRLAEEYQTTKNPETKQAITNQLTAAKIMLVVDSVAAVAEGAAITGTIVGGALGETLVACGTPVASILAAPAIVAGGAYYIASNVRESREERARTAEEWLEKYKNDPDRLYHELFTTTENLSVADIHAATYTTDTLDDISSKKTEVRKKIIRALCEHELETRSFEFEKNEKEVLYKILDEGYGLAFGRGDQGYMRHAFTSAIEFISLARLSRGDSSLQALFTAQELDPEKILRGESLVSPKKVEMILENNLKSSGEKYETAEMRQERELRSASDVLTYALYCYAKQLGYPEVLPDQKITLEALKKFFDPKQEGERGIGYSLITSVPSGNPMVPGRISLEKPADQWTIGYNVIRGIEDGEKVVDQIIATLERQPEKVFSSREDSLFDFAYPSSYDRKKEIGHQATNLAQILRQAVGDYRAYQSREKQKAAA